MNSLTSGQSKVLPVIVIQNDTLPHIQLPEVSVIVRKRNHNYYERQHQKTQSDGLQCSESAPVRQDSCSENQ